MLNSRYSYRSLLIVPLLKVSMRCIQIAIGHSYVDQWHHLQPVLLLLMAKPLILLLLIINLHKLGDCVASILVHCAHECLAGSAKPSHRIDKFRISPGAIEKLQARLPRNGSYRRASEAIRERRRSPGKRNGWPTMIVVCHGYECWILNSYNVIQNSYKCSNTIIATFVFIKPWSSLYHYANNSQLQ